MTSWRLQIRKPVAMPACNRFGNGAIPVGEMSQTFPKLGQFGYLAPAAARAWAAMSAAAATDGVPLSSTGAYRPLAAQESLFRSRYTPATPNMYLPGRRKWRDQWWAKNPGVAAAAVPGTSNHGWAIAVDACLPGNVGLDRKAIGWLEEHASVYGWAWELPSEVWHIRHLLGDDVTAAVVEFERGSEPAPTRRSDVVFLAKQVGTEQVWLVDGNKRHALSAAAVSVYQRRPEVDPVPMVLTPEEMNAFTVTV